MNKNVIIFALFALSFNSCNFKHDKLNDRIIAEENELLEQLFCDLIKPIPSPPKPGELEKDTTVIIDTNRYEVYLIDSLCNSDDFDFQNIMLPLEYKNRFNNLTIKDLNPRKLNINSMAINCKYKIKTDIKIDSTLQDKKMNHHFIGIVRFSRVSFNADFSKACFFQSISKGRNSGSGFLIFAEKKSSDWVLVFKHTIWVS